MTLCWKFVLVWKVVRQTCVESRLIHSLLPNMKLLQAETGNICILYDNSSKRLIQQKGIDTFHLPFLKFKCILFFWYYLRYDKHVKRVPILNILEIKACILSRSLVYIKASRTHIVCVLLVLTICAYISNSLFKAKKLGVFLLS